MKEPFGIQFPPTISIRFDPPRYLIRLLVLLGAHVREEPVHTPWCSYSFFGRFSSRHRVRPRVTNSGGGKAGNRDEKDATSGGVATLHTPILETLAAGPSARVRPRVTDGGGVKADD